MLHVESVNTNMAHTLHLTWYPSCPTDDTPMALSGVLDVWVYQAVNEAKLWRRPCLFGRDQNVTQTAEDQRPICLFIGPAPGCDCNSRLTSVPQTSLCRSVRSQWSSLGRLLIRHPHETEVSMTEAIEVVDQQGFRRNEYGAMLFNHPH